MDTISLVIHMGLKVKGDIISKMCCRLDYTSEYLKTSLMYLTNAVCITVLIITQLHISPLAFEYV